MSKTKQPPIRVGLISLGCAKNLVDAEIMLGSLMKCGIEITNDAAGADAVIVNTCSFIDAAQEESVDAILESAELRDKTRPGQAVIVAGCMTQRFREELPKLMPEVDAFMGIDQVAQVPEIVRAALERRAARSSAGQIAARPSKRRVTERLDQLNRIAGKSDHSDEESLRGTKAFGNTRTVVTSKAAASAGAPGATASPLVNVAHRPTYIPDYATPRFRLTPQHFAYVKIAEGCNHPCSFCTIPRMRGSHRSRALDDIVKEARHLIADGVKELNLISQDSTFYGLDLRPNRAGSIAAPDRFAKAAASLTADTPTLCSLLRALNKLKGDFWIRLLYTHPAHWTDELIHTISECGKVARYVDMPLQHIHEAMLQRMRRETSEQYIRDLIARIRAGVPGIAVRTTFIVGFPGETQEYFETLQRFIRETKFERLGVFTYSQEDGTIAGKMAAQLPDRVKKKRRDLAMAEQLKVARELAASFVGRTIKVLVEKEASTKELATAQVSSWEHGLIRGADDSAAALRGRYLVARGEADAPDIDGRVYVRGELPMGEFAHVKVVGHTDYDLIAEPATI